VALPTVSWALIRPAWPFGNLARASIKYLTRLAAEEIGSQLNSPRAKRRRGTQALLEHLSTFEGKTWQERWQDSRLDSGGHPVHELGGDKYHGYNLTHGLKALDPAQKMAPGRRRARRRPDRQPPSPSRVRPR
jgi:hypothetical protein